MTRLSLILAAMIGLFLQPVQAAGLKYVRIPAGAEGSEIEAAIWSPCTEAPHEVQVRALTVLASPDCAIAGEKLPLVVISHGYGGWYFGHHDTAEALADAGFVVVAINHPHANYADMTRANGLSALIGRPVDIRRTIDFMLGDFPDAGRIDPQKIGFYGFSQGGYTGLVLAGADPDFRNLPPRCADPNLAGCSQPRPAHSAQQAPVPQALTHDPRIRAMVVADPLNIVFQSADNVKHVTIPLQLWVSELGGGNGASPDGSELLARNLPQKPDMRIVRNAVHMSFLTICPKAALSSEVCRDAPGFDRAAFHEEFNAEVVAFLRRHLVK